MTTAQKIRFDSIVVTPPASKNTEIHSNVRLAASVRRSAGY